MAKESPKIVWVPPGIPGPVPVSEGYEIRPMRGLQENRAGSAAAPERAGRKKAGARKDAKPQEAGGNERRKGSRKRGKQAGERIWGKSPFGWEARRVTDSVGDRTVGRDWVPAKPLRKRRQAKEGFQAGAGHGGGAWAAPGAGVGVGPGSPGRLVISRDWAPDKTWDWQGADPGARGWAEPEGAVQAQLGGAEYVPPEIEAMAGQVMAAYEMRVSGMHLITTKADKGGAIWRIETDKGPRSLKLLHRPPARSLFSVGLQEYVSGRGGRVPKLIPSRHGLPFTVIDGRMWIVTDWITPLTPAPKVGLEGAQKLCYGLGEFHMKSSGYVPPAGAEKASRLYKWPRTYQKVQSKIGWFRHLAEAYPEMAASRTLLSMVDRFEEQAARACEALEQSPYGKLVALGEPHFGVVHQDYGWSNGQIGPDGEVWLIDLDGVAYDLPIRDLRKLITSTMDDMGNWDVTWIRGMIEAYSKACPIDADLLRVLLIDMALPNEFYKHVKASESKKAPAHLRSKVRRVNWRKSNV